MTDALPASVNFVSVTPSQGTCSGTSTIECFLGTLPPFNIATVTLVVTPMVAGPLSNTASAPHPYDEDPSDNSVYGVYYGSSRSDAHPNSYAGGAGH